MDWKLEARIRERAYQIWEREGRPGGRDFDHWTRAVAEVQAEETGSVKAKPEAAAAAASAPAKAPPAKKKKVNGSAGPKVAPAAIKKAAAKPKGKGTSARS